MALLKRRSFLDNNRISLIQPELISPNPDQPRRNFDPTGLSELAESIRIHGILQPLTVRRRNNGGYELVAGERRLRAAMLCGLHEVPCLVIEVTRENSALLALMENLQRRDLDFLEEALALDRLISQHGLSQEEVAMKIGKSQSAVANKLRLLRLPRETLELLRRNGYTERHARALLRLPGADLQHRAAEVVVAEGYTVARTEQYVLTLLDDALRPLDEDAPTPRLHVVPPPAPRRTLIIRDVRFFLNTINNGLSVMRSAGVDAACKQEEEEDSILLTIRIPKNPTH